MPAGIAAPRQARARYRHELRTLTYVTLDESNGGVIRNLTREGIGVQAMSPLRPKEQLRVQFELRYPRLRVDTRGEVVWSNFSGQCGIRFLDLPTRIMCAIDEWIFGSLLETGSALTGAEEGSDGLMISPGAMRVIELPVRGEPRELRAGLPANHRRAVELDWLSQPLSPRALAWTVNTLIVASAALLFGLVFLGVTHEPPPWPYALATGAIGVVFALYWTFFRLFGGMSVGARLAQLTRATEEEEPATRFR